jgi:hypothetical protein
MNWLKEDFTPKSEVLIIALSSFFGLKNDPNKWEWEKSTGILESEIPFKRMFVKDINEGWYQTQFEGVDGIGPHALTSFIKERIKESGAKRVLMMGLSLGGYGAILLGCLCKIDLALAISPQTYLTNLRYKKNNLHQKYEGLNINKEETNLKVVLDRYNNNFTKYNIYYGKYNLNDVAMAEKIKDCNGVNLYPIESSKHTVVDPLRESGELKNILIKFIRNEL